MISPLARTPRFYLPIVLVGALLAWSYWTTLAEMVWRWNHDPQYSHGYLVPAFAIYVLWSRRQLLQPDQLNASWLGVGLLAGSMALRLAGTLVHVGYLDQMSLLGALAGLFALVGGLPALRWSWPALAFLSFMVPLPHSWSVALSAPMQTFATHASTFGLQVLGRPAIAEGNLILLNEIELGIVEACSGLRMLVVFFALSTAVAMLVAKPMWERWFIALSAIPIALASNVLRITATGLVFDAFGNNWGGALFHDLAGWLMMPLGLAFLGVELWVLKHLLIEPSAGLEPAALVTLQRVPLGPGLYSQGTRRQRAQAAAVATSPVPADGGAVPASSAAPAAPASGAA